jgi:hypothetical protein
LSYGGCPYTASYDAVHWNDNATFANVSEFTNPVIKDPVCKVFNVPQNKEVNMTFTGLYDLCDILVAEDFEGIKPRGKFTEEQWYYIRA